MPRPRPQGHDYEFPDIFPKKDDDEAPQEKTRASETAAARAEPLEIEGVERIPERKGEAAAAPSEPATRA